MKEISDYTEEKLSKLTEEELDNSLCEAMAQPQFQDYMKFLQKDLGFESIEEVESQCGTNDPYHELLDFCLWVEREDLKAASKKLTPATVATPQKHLERHITWAPEVPAPKAPATASPPAKPAPAQPMASVNVNVADTSQAIHPMDYNERQALQGVFKRRLKDPEANSIPKEFVNLWNDAVEKNNKAAKTALFAKWLEAGKDWSLLQIESSKTHTDRTVDTKKRRWRTRAQIIALHGGDHDAADRVIAKKRQEGMVQGHPDDPDLETFYVVTELGRKDEEEVADETKYGSKAELTHGCEAAQKLMKGLDHTKAFAEPSGNLCRQASAAAAPVAPPPSVDGGKGKGRGKGRGRGRGDNGQPRTGSKTKKTMPDLEDDPLGAAGWMVTQILKDLQNAKVLPIKIVNMKHQEGLRNSLIQCAIDLEKCYFQLKGICDVSTEESRPEHFPGLSQCLNDAMGVRQHYVELASMAESLCKPKGGRKSQKVRDDEDSPDMD